MTSLTAMTDSEFWAEVRGLLSRIGVGELDDTVTSEAERRDAELGRLRRERQAIFAASSRRAFDAGFDPLDLDAPGLTEDEEQRAAGLASTYRQRFADLTGIA